MGAIAKNKYKTLHALTVKAGEKKHGHIIPIARLIYTWSVMKGKLIPESNNAVTPLNDHLYNLLLGEFRELFASELEFQNIFDRFEYLYALIHADSRIQAQEPKYFPIGSFIRGKQLTESWFRVQIATEADELKDEWPPLKAGLFGGSYERFNNAKEKFNELLNQM